MCAPQSRPRALIPHAVKRSGSWLSFPPVWCSVHARTAVCPSYHKCPSGLFAVWGRSGGYLEASAFRSPLPLPSLPSTLLSTFLSPLLSSPLLPPPPHPRHRAPGRGPEGEEAVPGLMNARAMVPFPSASSLRPSEGALHTPFPALTTESFPPRRCTFDAICKEQPVTSSPIKGSSFFVQGALARLTPFYSSRRCGSCSPSRT